MARWEQVNFMRGPNFVIAVVSATQNFAWKAILRISSTIGMVSTLNFKLMFGA